MADPVSILPDQLEILATRMLRAAGLTLDAPRVLERTRPDARSSDYTMLLALALRGTKPPRRVIADCRRNTQPIAAADLDALANRFSDDVIAVFATGGYADGAPARAGERGIALFRVTDARAGFEGWGVPGQVPAWLPEFTAIRAGGADLPA